MNIMNEIKSIYESNLKEMLLQDAIIKKRYVGPEYLDAIDDHLQKDIVEYNKFLKWYLDDDEEMQEQYLKHMKKGYVKEGKIVFPALGLDVEES